MPDANAQFHHVSIYDRQRAVINHFIPLVPVRDPDLLLVLTNQQVELPEFIRDSTYEKEDEHLSNAMIFEQYKAMIAWCVANQNHQNQRLQGIAQNLLQQDEAQFAKYYTENTVEEAELQRRLQANKGLLQGELDAEIKEFRQAMKPSVERLKAQHKVLMSQAALLTRGNQTIQAKTFKDLKDTEVTLQQCTKDAKGYHEGNPSDHLAAKRARLDELFDKVTDYWEGQTKRWTLTKALSFAYKRRRLAVRELCEKFDVEFEEGKAPFFFRAC